MEAFWKHFGASWGVRGHLEGIFKSILSHLEGFGALLGGLGALSAILGAILGGLGALLGRPWVVLGRLWEAKIDPKIAPKPDPKSSRIATEKNRSGATPVVDSAFDPP